MQRLTPSRCCFHCSALIYLTLYRVTTNLKTSRFSWISSHNLTDNLYITYRIKHHLFFCCKLIHLHLAVPLFILSGDNQLLSTLTLYTLFCCVPWPLHHHTHHNKQASVQPCCSIFTCAGAFLSVQMLYHHPTCFSFLRVHTPPTESGIPSEDTRLMISDK